MARKAKKIEVPAEQFCVIKDTVRRFSRTEKGAVETARHLIETGAGDSWLMVQVLKKVRRSVAVEVTEPEFDLEEPQTKDKLRYPDEAENWWFRLTYDQIYHHTDDLHRARLVAKRKTGEWPQW
jgi:hypothetical protein